MPEPSTAAPAVAAAPAVGSRPVTALTAAAPDTGPYTASSQDPTLIGELVLNTRSMFRKREGRPRSLTSATPDSAMAAVALTLALRASCGLPEACANAASTEDAPATPPRNRYPGTSGLFHTGALSTGRP